MPSTGCSLWPPPYNLFRLVERFSGRINWSAKRQVKWIKLDNIIIFNKITTLKQQLPKRLNIEILKRLYSKYDPLTLTIFILGQQGWCCLGRPPSARVSLPSPSASRLCSRLYLYSLFRTRAEEHSEQNRRNSNGNSKTTAESKMGNERDVRVKINYEL